MASANQTPGIYIEENFKLPASIESVKTAIPAFIGYTEKAQEKEVDDLHNKPWKVDSLLQYEQYFGFPDPERNSLSVTFTSTAAGIKVKGNVDEKKRSRYLMYYSLQMYFDNGGGPCWITSVGNYTRAGSEVIARDLLKGLEAVAGINEVTLLVFPDAVNLSSGRDYYSVYEAALQQCESLCNRFTVLDVFHDPVSAGQWEADIQMLRNSLNGTADILKHGAAYFPKIFTSVNFNYKVAGDPSKDNEATVIILGGDAGNLADLKSVNVAQYQQAKIALTGIEMLLPVSSAIAGIYKNVDNSRGVWKAPANINIVNAVRPEYLINQQDQEGLNVDSVTGKSFNTIKKFAGRGPAIVWGARTLAGNDNEWRYVPVLRFCSMVKESIRKATEQFIFEPNDSNTWTRVRIMIENYLIQLWRDSALMGTTPDQAFFVKAGLGGTMTELDLEEGRMIIIVGLAAVRPAEFILIRITQNMLPKP